MQRQTSEPLQKQRGEETSVASQAAPLPLISESAAAAVKEFEGQWPMLMDTVSATIQKLFSMRDTVLGDMRANVEGLVVCAVSNPLAKDCPLVFLSRGFEEMTGYRNDVGLGRNCRFLQPTPAMLNHRINGDEISRMRAFCTQEIRPGMERSIINIILNQRKSGERFWNLLHMQFVEVQGRPYILGVQTILNLPMPVVIRSVVDSEAFFLSDEAAFSVFVDELRGFLAQLRMEVTINPSEDMKVAQESVTASILAFMRKASTDYEGDHYVPLVGKDKVALFQHEVKWHGILNEVNSSLFQVWQVSERHEEIVACAVSDPSGEDCPLVYVSREFEILTGYNREWVLGRNCRFLQPNHSWRNDAFNSSDRNKMGVFCREPQPKGTRIVNLLVNEHKNGYPFWNLLIMEHITVLVQPRGVAIAQRVLEHRPYIFGVQTSLEAHISKLVEMLAMDRVGLAHLARLRGALQENLETLGVQPLRAWSRGVIDEWLQGLPPFMVQPTMSLPSFVSSRPLCSLPKYGLEVTHETAMEEVPKALEDGVRHFYVSFTLEDRHQGDASYAMMQSRLLALRLGELFAQLKTKFLHYLRDAITFTLVTPPLFVDSFEEVCKSMKNNGYSPACWMLDLRGMEPRNREKKLRDSWQTMVAAQRAGRVQALGICGASKETYLEVCRCSAPATVSSCMVEMYAGRPDWDCSYTRWLNQLRDSGVMLIAHNVLGPRHCLLTTKGLTEAALKLQVDPAVVLARWAESQGFGVMLPKLRSGAVPSRCSQSRKTISLLGSETVARAAARELAPVVLREEVETASSGSQIHRTFLRELYKVPLDLECFKFADNGFEMVEVEEPAPGSRPVLRRRSTMHGLAEGEEAAAARSPRRQSSSRQNALGAAPAPRHSLAEQTPRSTSGSARASIPAVLLSPLASAGGAGGPRRSEGAAASVHAMTLPELPVYTPRRGPRRKSTMGEQGSEALGGQAAVAGSKPGKAATPELLPILRREGPGTRSPSETTATGGTDSPEEARTSLRSPGSSMEHSPMVPRSPAQELPAKRFHRTRNNTVRASISGEPHEAPEADSGGVDSDSPNAKHIEQHKANQTASEAKRSKPPSAQARMAGKLAAKGVSLEDIADAMELTREEVEALICEQFC